MTFITPDQRTSSAPNGSRMSMPAHLEAMIHRPFKKVNWRGPVVSQKMEAAKSEFVKKSAQEQKRRNKLAKMEMILRKAKLRSEPIETIAPAPQEDFGDSDQYLTHPLRFQRLYKLFCEVTGALHIELISERRPRKLAEKRQMCMWLLKRNSTRSLPVIGRKFGGRDHSTVWHACRKINGNKALLAIAQEIETTVLLLEREMYGDA